MFEINIRVKGIEGIKNIMKRAHIIISGIVQGVSYRRFTEENAKKLGLKGYVKNMPNGDVEAMIEGPEISINQLIKKLKEGPPASKVKEVKISWHIHKNE